MLKLCALLLTLRVASFVSGEIFSTDVFHGDSVINRKFVDKDLNYNTILLPSTIGAEEGHLIGFKYYTAESNAAIHLGIWRFSYGTAYVLVAGQYINLDRSTSTAGVQIQYLDSPAPYVKANDLIGITFVSTSNKSKHINPIPYDVPTVNSSCTYYTKVLALSPGVICEFKRINTMCRKYSVQAILDKTYAGSPCDFHTAHEFHDYNIVSHITCRGSNYQNNYDKCWILRGTSESEKMRIYSNDFQVEQYSDYLYVSYQNGNSLVSLKYTGNNGPYYVYSHDFPPYMKVQFTTDGNGTREGFTLFFGSSLPQVTASPWKWDSIVRHVFPWRKD